MVLVAAIGGGLLFGAWAARDFLAGRASARECRPLGEILGSLATRGERVAARPGLNGGGEAVFRPSPSGSWTLFVPHRDFVWVVEQGCKRHWTARGGEGQSELGCGQLVLKRADGGASWRIIKVGELQIINGRDWLRKQEPGNRSEE